MDNRWTIRRVSEKARKQIEELRQQFVSGDFAIALHGLTGWCLVNFFSPTQGRVHSGVLHPTGKVVDFDGFMTLAAHYGEDTEYPIW
jgi:hypothetical protein